MASGKFRNCVAIINSVAKNNSTVGYASMRTAQLSYGYAKPILPTCREGDDRAAVVGSSLSVSLLLNRTTSYRRGQARLTRKVTHKFAG